MILVAQLTESQAVELSTIEFIPDTFFNPIKDINGTWVISLEEVEQCSKSSYIRLNGITNN